ncbi:Mut7-C RNAse domain-containing protein [Solitalea koreensis]|uniref:Mut7-C RNAse domain-containing protein n=1 Tax=Solitalea koreensis TaxID=543615 RepID=UPI001C8F984E
MSLNSSLLNVVWSVTASSKKIPKASVIDQLPADTCQYFNEFFQCTSCQRIYWKGSHYDRMKEMVARVNGIL